MKAIKINSTSRMFIITAFVLFCMSCWATASVTIKGQVFDENNEPIEYATATLINPETHQIVVGDMCDKHGEFILEKVTPGKYVLSVRNVGFEKNEVISINVESENTLIESEPLVLKKAVIELPEIMVVSKRLTYPQPIKPEVNYQS